MGKNRTNVIVLYYFFYFPNVQLFINELELALNNIINYYVVEQIISIYKPILHFILYIVT